MFFRTFLLRTLPKPKSTSSFLFNKATLFKHSAQVKNYHSGHDEYERVEYGDSDEKVRYKLNKTYQQLEKHSKRMDEYERATGGYVLSDSHVQWHRSALNNTIASLEGELERREQGRGKKCR